MRKYESNKYIYSRIQENMDMVGLLTQTYGFLSGYHMNKKYWITMLLDGRVSEAKILDFLDLSYDLIDQKKADGRNDHR